MEIIGKDGKIWNTYSLEYDHYDDHERHHVMFPGVLTQSQIYAWEDEYKQYLHEFDDRLFARYADLRKKYNISGTPVDIASMKPEERAAYFENKYQYDQERKQLDQECKIESSKKQDFMAFLHGKGVVPVEFESLNYRI